jgi:hypothetical protein
MGFWVVGDLDAAEITDSELCYLLATHFGYWQRPVPVG